MKKVLLTAALIGFSALCFTASAQEDKEVIIEKAKKDKAVAEKERKETQEIIIRKKGDKDTKITVEIKGDKITVNGKPLNEFKDGDITINKREFKFFDGQHNFAFGPGEEMEMLLNGDRLGSFGMDEGKPRAFLGVTTNSNVEDGKEAKNNGAEISSVSKGSAAEKAGLKEGDIITKVDNDKIENPSDLTDAITSHKPKDEVTVYYKRDGKDMSAKAVLGETRASRAMTYSFSGPGGQYRSFSIPRNNMPPRIQTVPGFQWNEDINRNFEPFKELTVTGFPRQQKLGLRIQDTEDGGGVKVLDADKDSPAEKAGLQKDDIVTEIGGVKVNNTDDAREQLHENAGKPSYTIKAKRNGKEMSFDIKIPKKLKTADL